MKPATKVCTSTFALIAVLVTCLMSSNPTAAAGLIAPAEREVTYTGAGGVMLTGTLLIPSHSEAAKLPAVLIIGGGGRMDRNGTGGIYKQMAEALAQQGIASLRYDKRTFAPITSPASSEDAAMTEFVAWVNIVGDAKASLAYLQQQPEVNATRTALLGHSEGGLAILQIYQDGISGIEPPAATILAATPGRSYAAILRQQLMGNLAAANTNAADSQAALDSYDAAIDSIKQTGKIPTNLPAKVAAVLPTPIYGKFLQQICLLLPAEATTKIPGPVLLLQGQDDTTVSPQLDTAALDAALVKRNPDDHATHLVPNMGHMFNDTGDSLSPAIPAAATDELEAWTAAKLNDHTSSPPLPMTGQANQYPQLILIMSGLSLLAIAAGWRLHRQLN